MITAQPNKEKSPVRWQTLFNPNHFFGSVLVGIVSGVVGGLLIGAASRVSMRVVALLADMPPSFSIDGTLAIITFGALFGALTGLVYGFSLPSLPGSYTQKGLVFGGILSFLSTCIIRPQSLPLLPPLLIRSSKSSWLSPIRPFLILAMICLSCWTMPPAAPCC